MRRYADGGDLAPKLHRLPDRGIVAYVGATLIDGTGAPAVPDATVLIAGGRILAAGPRASVAVPSESGRADVSGRVIVPGLIDCHVHLVGDTTNDPNRRYLEATPYVRVLRAAAQANRILSSGFTTVRHLGHGNPTHIEAVRQSIRDGEVTGPRILSSGWALSQSGGHGNLRLWPLELVEQLRPRSAFVDGVDDCREMVKRIVAGGGDCIKIYSSEGLIYTPDRLSDIPNFTVAEIEAICDEAHRAKIHVAAHSTGVQATLNALRGGVDTVEHGPNDADDEVLDLLVRTGASLVPTLSIYEWTSREGSRAGYAPWVLERSARHLESRREMVRVAHARGVRIATGTDSGGPPRGGANAEEIGALARAGLSAIDALVAATSAAATAIGLGDETGSIVPGKRAELLVLSVDPLDRIDALTEPANIASIVLPGLGHAA